MITGYIIIGLFFFAAILALLERYLGWYRLLVYLLLGVLLVVVASLREIGIDPDSESYEFSFLHIDTASSDVVDRLELSYIWISSFINLFTNDVHYLFFIYAFLGLTIKFIAFRRLTEFWFLPVIVYIGYYFIAHEMMQIRTAVLSGFFLLALYHQVEGRRLLAVLLILLGSFFHYSGFILLPLLFLSSEHMSLKRRFVWLALIPASYLVFFFGVNVLFSSDIPLIGSKIMSYQSEEDVGKGVGYVNVFRPLHVFSILLLTYLLFFYESIVKKSKYFTLLLKVFILGLCAYQVFGFLPVLAQRLNMLLLIVTIPLYTYVYYTIRPNWVAVLVVMLIAFVHLNYSLPLINTYLFWNG